MGDRRSRLIPSSSGTTTSVKAIKLSEINSAQKERIDTGIGELNRVLGGGIVRGSLTLISGEPGIGKSTLILQTAIKLAEKQGVVLYVSGEESEEQLKMRADRLAESLPENLLILAETDMDNIASIVTETKPVFLIIDSVQTMYTSEIESVAGSVSQVRACTGDLMRMAKVLDIPIFIVAHVTKSGELAGPKIIEHMVDCVLHFSGERDHDFRILRANKNRFGTTSEIGAFEMKEEGLVEIHDLSGSLLEGMDEATEGAIATAVNEGSRPLLLEIQALTSTAGAGFPRRTSIGVEIARLNMIIAVLERKAKMTLSSSDIYVNVVGGIKADGTSVDLAVALSIWSSAKNIAISPHTLAIGEIGLTGEIRSVKGVDKIIKEAAKLGFNKIILPKKNVARLTETSDVTKDLKIIGVSNIIDAINSL